ncbi:MAG: rubredoxin [Novosphingobium sp.]|nr:rubredoxin [Novosphingobium sp.]
MSTSAYRKWQCTVCGEIYDEALGQPDEGIAAGTRFEDLPEWWICTGCGGGKDGFVLYTD